MTGRIDPSARVHPGARLAADVEIGPYSIVGEHVEIGEGS
jgi:UDP-N-acetylglucosamine acyltransferase